MSYYATIIFALAVVHTFLSPWLHKTSLRLREQKKARLKHSNFYHFSSEVLFLLSEIEVIFGIWLIPLLIGMVLITSTQQTIQFLQSHDYTDALYIMVILVIVASRPIITFMERILEVVARLGKDSPSSWWWTIMILAPISGALLKEPGAMALGAILLLEKFYVLNSSERFKYATMGLFFVNVSIGGMLTPFASRALFIVADKWDWSVGYMMGHFGWKAIISILVANTLYFILFRKEFPKYFPREVLKRERSENDRPTPIWITVVHLLFLAAVAYWGEYAPIFLGFFVLFLGFHRATSFYQRPLQLREGLLIGFFFASLIIHGDLQDWWVIPLFSNLPESMMVLVSCSLSAILDNAEVIYLGSKAPNLTETLRDALVIGAMASGGLTIIANAPNPIGLVTLRESFKKEISFWRLFRAALIPTLIVLAVFWVFKNVSF